MLKKKKKKKQKKKAKGNFSVIFIDNETWCFRREWTLAKG